MEVDEVIVYLLPAPSMGHRRRRRGTLPLLIPFCCRSIIGDVWVIAPHFVVASIDNALRLLHQCLCITKFLLQRTLFVAEPLLSIFLLSGHFCIGNLLEFREFFHFLKSLLRLLSLHRGEFSIVSPRVICARRPCRTAGCTRRERTGFLERCPAWTGRCWRWRWILGWTRALGPTRIGALASWIRIPSPLLFLPGTRVFCRWRRSWLSARGGGSR